MATNHWIGTASDLGGSSASSYPTGYNFPYDPAGFNPVRAVRSTASMNTWAGAVFSNFGNYDQGNLYVLKWPAMKTIAPSQYASGFWDNLYNLMLTSNAQIYWSPDNRVTKYPIQIIKMDGTKHPIAPVYLNVEITLERR